MCARAALAASLSDPLQKTLSHCPSNNPSSSASVRVRAVCNPPCKNGGVCLDNGFCDCSSSFYTGPDCSQSRAIYKSGELLGLAEAESLRHGNATMQELSLGFRT